MIDEKSLSRLLTFHGHLQAHDLLEVMIKEEFSGKIAMVSSFGAGSALLLAIVAEVDPNLPVLFLETKKHFPETLAYVETLKKELGLKNVQLLLPDPEMTARIDPEGQLWHDQPNRCCWLRKVEPLRRALEEGGYEALITGRKRYQTADRADMEAIEQGEDGRYRINPLAFWSEEKVTQEREKRHLPEHALVSQGYKSIGCAPCTRPVKEGEDPRAGRWAHTAELPGGEKKVECGIHTDGAKPAKPEWDI